MPTPTELKDPRIQQTLRKILPPAPALPRDIIPGKTDVHIAKSYSAEAMRDRQRGNASKQSEGQAYERDDDDMGNGHSQQQQCRPM